MVAPDFQPNPPQTAAAAEEASSDESSSSSSSTGSSTGTSTGASSGSSSDESTAEPLATTAAETSETGGESTSSGSSTGAATKCGDDVIEGDEECEGTQFCHECHIQRHVFVSSLSFEAAEIGGLAHADVLCQLMAATNPDLPNPGKYRAWLSDSFTSAGDRVGLDLAGRYTLPDDVTVVAEVGADFLTANLQGFGIDHDEHMNPEVGNVWTGTGPTGQRIEDSQHCINWTTEDPAQKGYYGRIGANDASWTLSDSMINPNSCLLHYHIYCFEGQ